MKAYKISLILILLLFTMPANAQRPVWLIGHGANWGNSTKKALEQGANGVEIDVRTKTVKSVGRVDRKGAHWSVAHDAFWDEPSCDGKTQFSLKQYLQLIPELKNPGFCILWIDCKDDEYMKELIEYVHSATPGGTDYSIVYNAYSIENVRKNISWIAANLRSNEGINWADVRPNPLGDFLARYGVKSYQHFYTRGWCWSKVKMGKGSERINDIAEANGKKTNDEFCCRTGAWTAITGYDGLWFLDSKTSGCATDFDVTLAYFDGGWRLPLTSGALKNCRERINKIPTRLKMATRQDSFFRTWKKN